MGYGRNDPEIQRKPGRQGKQATAFFGTHPLLVLLKTAVFLFLMLAVPKPVLSVSDTEMAGSWGICESGTLTLFEGVQTLGEYYGEPDMNYGMHDSDPEIEALFEGNPGSHLMFVGDEPAFSRVIWPSTIRMLGAESFCVLDFPELSLPASLERLYPDVFIYSSFGTLRIECALPFEQIWAAMEDCTVSAYDVPENHPLYSVREGVLYSKDGKTLVDYPNGREAEHFDIPAGVECIGAQAFHTERLKTVSLPIGLKSIESGAFANCTRLQAISVPLTVTHLEEDAFEGCISLERISLPHGMTAEKAGDEGDWVYYPDDDLFRGDNGDTIARNREKQGAVSWEEKTIFDAPFAWVREENEIPVYDKSDESRMISILPGGTPVRILSGTEEKCWVASADSGREIGMVDTAKLDFCPESTLFQMEAVPPEEFGGSGQGIWATILGPWVDFYGLGTFPLTEVELYREPVKGYGRDEMGITTDEDPLKRLPLLDAPDGEEFDAVHVGTQIRILEQQSPWIHVSTGFTEGWMNKESVRIIPVNGEGENPYR